MRLQMPEGMKGKELFTFLIANKAQILDMKKSDVKIADTFASPPLVLFNKQDDSEKKYLYRNDQDKGELERTIVMNTYNWLDGHDDVHLDGVFTKSISERGQRAPHLHDHLYQLDAQVGAPIKWYEEQIKWRALGVDKSGNTTALFLESLVLKELNDFIYKQYLGNRINQHSVRMGYEKIKLAINDPDQKEEYAVWNTVYPKLGNPDTAEKQGYFFAVAEGRLVEGSAVISGSNELTPTMSAKVEPPKSTQHSTKSLNINELLESYKQNRS